MSNSWEIIKYLDFGFQISSMSPKRSILKRLLEGGIKGSPVLLKPLCNLVCMLPTEELVSLQPLLSDLNAAVWSKPSLHHIQLSVLQHCRKSGINLNLTHTPGVTKVIKEAEPGQAISSIPPSECNSMKRPDNNKNNSVNSIRNQSNNTNCYCNNSSNKSNNNNSNSGSNNSDSTSSDIIMGNLQTSTSLVESVNIKNEGSRYEVQGSDHLKSITNDDEPCQGVVTGGAVSTTSEVPLPPSPTSLPPSGPVELFGNNGPPKQTEPKRISLIRPVLTNKQVTSGRELKHLQQSMVENSSCQQPSLGSSCNSGTRDKTFTNIDLGKDTFELRDLLLTPESTGTSGKLDHENIKRGLNSGTNSSTLEPKPLYSVYYPGSDITRQGAPSIPLCTRQKLDSKSTSTKVSNVEKAGHNLLEASGEDSQLGGVEVPEFCITRKRNNTFPKTSSTQYIENGGQNVNQRPELNLPPFDATTYMDVDDELDFGKPQKFSQESEKVFQTSCSVNDPVQREQLGNYRRRKKKRRNIRAQQTNRPWMSQQEYEQSHFPAQFTHMSSNSYNTQQHLW